MAEVYHIYNYKTYPASYIATLVFGLRDDSRVKIALSEYPVGLDTLLMASIADSCAFLVWSQTEDAQHGNNKPDSLVMKLCGKSKEADSNIMTFNSPEEFELARAQLIGE